MLANDYENKTYSIARKMVAVRDRKSFAKLIEEGEGCFDFSKRRSLPPR